MTTFRNGDDLLAVLAALDNPHRLRILANLTAGRNYVSQLAREIGLSRPLTHIHLKRLEDSGLVAGGHRRACTEPQGLGDRSALR